MLKNILLIIISGAMVSCKGSNDYQPLSYLTTDEQDERMSQIIRYMGRAPEGLSMEERFYKAYDDHYREQQNLHRLDAYYIGEDKKHYFLVSRVAPSLTKKRVAFGGALQVDQAGQLTMYEEVFRTWKMSPDTLATRSMFLFDKMAQGEKLDAWYSGKSRNTDYIEFPDDLTYFDIGSRSWKTR